MWGLDLDRYQFDGFLTWAIFLLNADGTIYGRYGSRSESGHDAASDKLISVEGFKETLERTLELHNEYTLRPDQLRRALADKNGPKHPPTPRASLSPSRRTIRTSSGSTSGECIVRMLLADPAE